MRSLHKALIVLWLAAAAGLAAVAWTAWQAWLSNGEPALVTGYTLVGLFLFLGFFNVRKRLSMIPLGRGAYWTAAHGIAGGVAIAIFFVHTRGTMWPDGSYEQLLALFFYLVSLTGLVGYWQQRVLPRRLTENGLEVIWERIPGEIAELREKAERLVEEAADKAASDTLARFYVETWSWFFRRPRFLLSHFFGFQSGEAFIRRESTAIRRYLDETEREYLRRLEELALLKNRLDFAYSVNGFLKVWLLVHVPLSAGALLLMLWHVILVHVYLL